MATTHSNIGNIFQDVRKLDEALERYQEALKIRKKLAPRSLDIFSLHNNIGTIYHDKGEIDKALEQFQKALNIIKVLAPETLDIANVYNNIGISYQNKGETYKALAKFQKALNIIEELTPGSLNIAILYNNIGRIYQDQGKASKAIEQYQKSESKTHTNDNFITLVNEFRNNYDNAQKLITSFIKSSYSHERIEYILNHTDNHKDSSYYQLVKNIIRISIKLDFSHWKISPSLVHYTNADAALKILTEEETLKTGSYIKHRQLRNNINFRIYSSFYANDPEEGKILNTYLTPNNKEENQGQYHHCILSLFSGRNLDDLPTWQTYGDDGKGVAIYIATDGNLSKHKDIIRELERDKNKSYSTTKNVNVGLYKILYLNKKEKIDLVGLTKKKRELEDCKQALKNIKHNPSAQDQINKIGIELQELEIKEHLCHIKNILNKKPKDLSKKLSLLNIIAHLFKDDAYKHEQEVRLLYSTVYVSC